MRSKSMGNEILTFQFSHLSVKGASSLKPSVLGPGFTAPPGGEAYLNRLTLRTTIEDV